MAAPAEKLADADGKLQRYVSPAELLAFVRRKESLPEPGLMSVTLPARDYLDRRTFQLSVPAYQRLYEWSADCNDPETDVIGLLKDVCEAADKGFKFHLLNAVVLAVNLEKSAGGDTVLYAEIIDGQQRTTTLVIIYSVLTACIKVRRGQLAPAQRARRTARLTLTAAARRRCWRGCNCALAAH